ncbi:hypothetical protein [Sphingomonas daechungensis]|uniref:hypothetical protein n=1 Tax=Sphingomonas daechungensis TaxID=1176646 RepID=UPI0037850042
MTIDEFQSTSIALLRTAVGWQTKIAEKLDVSARQVRRWLALGEVPAWAEAKLAELTGLTDRHPWPRDEWLIGDAFGENGHHREYIMHMQAPRFIARIVACDDDGLPEMGEQPADVISGTVYSSDGYVLAEIVWLDEPRPGEVVQLLEAACNAIDGA